MGSISQDTRRLVVVLSPIAVLGLGVLAARLLMGPLGTLVWIPVVLVAWVAFAFMIGWGGGRGSIGRWLQPRRGAWGWPLLSVAVGLAPVYLFVLNWKLLSSPWLIASWILFALINPFLEEGYWRGLLMDNLDSWPSWLAVVYSASFFSANHPLTLGVFSVANRHPFTIAITFGMGLAWAVVYRKTRSIRWTVFGHALTDLFNLSVLTFQNAYIPPSLPWK